MKALKGLLIYMGIVLAMIAGIGVILFAIMYFFPSFRIFGLGVIHYNKDIVGETIDVDDYSVDDIVINVSSKSIKVNIVPVEVYDKNDKGKDTKILANEINYTLHLNVFGITTDIKSLQL